MVDRVKARTILRQARIDAGLTQERLAEASDLSVDHLRGFERGRNNVSVKAVTRIARALNVPLESLMEEDVAAVS